MVTELTVVTLLDGREFDSRPQRCRATTLGKLFTSTCLHSLWSKCCPRFI